MSIRGGFGHRLQSHDEEFNLSRLTKRAICFIWGYLKQFLGRLGLALLATLVTTGIALLLPYLVKVAVDDYIAKDNLSGLAVLSILYLSLAGLRLLAAYWQGYLSHWVGQHIIHVMRQDLFEKVTHQSLRFHEKEQVGQITSRLTNDVNAIANFISDGAVNLFADLIVVVGIIIIMFIIQWKLTLITLISIPLALFSMRFLGDKMRKAYSEVQQALADVNTGVEQGLAGMRVVKSLSRESFTIERFEQLSLQNMKANLKTSLIFAAVFPTMTITNMLGIALILGYGGSRIAAGQMSVGILMAFFAYVYRLYGPLRELGLVYGSIQAAGASLDRIIEYMDRTTELYEADKPRRPEDGFKGALQVEKVCFSYDEDVILKNIDFSVEAGTSVGIVGFTGAGKSTLAKLLARLYDVDEGVIRLDGVDVRDLAIKKLRQLVTIVPQDVFLFADSILENIRYGNPQASDEEVIAAARQAQVHRFISELAGGYNTEVGEMGVKLSGGQKQLLAFARAILANPKVLILDEATANVDPQTEAIIQQAMFSIARDRTTLIIAHRFSTLSRVEKILVLDEGKLVGYSTHENLLDDNTVYQRLYQTRMDSNQLSA